MTYLGELLTTCKSEKKNFSNIPSIVSVLHLNAI